MSELIKVAQIDQLPAGARKLCNVEGRRIALFNLGGTVYAIDNHCTHRDGPVGAGEPTRFRSTERTARPLRRSRE